MQANPECLNILTYWSKYCVDRVKRTLKKIKQEYSINRYINFATVFYNKLPTSTAGLLVVNSTNWGRGNWYLATNS